MAFLAITLAALIATAIIESEFVEEKEIKREIDRMADRSRKKQGASHKSRKYYIIYNQMLRMGGNAK
jgi:hypothetical protein